MHLLTLPYYIIIAFGFLFTLTAQNPVKVNSVAKIPGGKSAQILLEPGGIGIVGLPLESGRTNKVNPEGVKSVAHYTYAEDPLSRLPSGLTQLCDELAGARDQFVHLIFNEYNRAVLQAWKNANSKIVHDWKAKIGSSRVMVSFITNKQDVLVVITEENVLWVHGKEVTGIGRVRTYFIDDADLPNPTQIGSNKIGLMTLERRDIGIVVVGFIPGTRVIDVLSPKIAARFSRVVSPEPAHLMEAINKMFGSSSRDFMIYMVFNQYNVTEDIEKGDNLVYYKWSREFGDPARPAAEGHVSVFYQSSQSAVAVKISARNTLYINDKQRNK
jgi:hypothetical protein